MTQQTQPRQWISKPLAALLIAALAWSGSAHASVFDDALQCAVDAGKVMLLPVTEGAKVAAYAANQPQCVAQIIAVDPLTLAGAGAMVALNTAGVIPATFGGCQAAVYGPAMKPLAGALAGGLSAVGMPNSLVGPLQGIASGELMQGINQIPALAVITGPIDCGCGMLDAGVNVENIIAMGKTVASAGSSCTSLVGNVFNGALQVAQNPGKAINQGIETGLVAVIGRQGYSDLSGSWDSVVLGQSEAMPLPQLYQQTYAPKVARYAREMLKNWNYWNNHEHDITRHCVNYLDSHRWSEGNAREKCLAMLHGDHSSNEKRFVNAGFLQQVSARYAQLRLPADLERRRGLAGLNAVNGQAAAAPLAQNRLYGALGFDANGAAVLDAQGYPTYGIGSVGALASARLRDDTAQLGEGLPVMNQRIDEAVTYAMNNAPALQNWRAAMAAIPQIPCTLQPGGFFCGTYDQVNHCVSQYVERMNRVPEAVRVGEPRKVIRTPICLVANALQADQAALLNVRMSLKAEGIACNLGGAQNTQLVCTGGGHALGGVTTNDPTFVCNQRLRKLYGKFGLPRAGRHCTAATSAPPTGTATPPGGAGYQLPPPPPPPTTTTTVPPIKPNKPFPTTQRPPPPVRRY